MEHRWTPRRQGDLGELSAIQWLITAGAFVFIPLMNSPDYDMVADFDGKLVRVQVKTSTCYHKNRFVVALCTRGGNQSWNGVIKRLDATRCDRLFVHVGDGRRWYIPVPALGGRSGLTLGGPKYSEFEVERGDPLPARSPRAPEVGP
jgi:PD-(D/E)XK endonuclease